MNTIRLKAFAKINLGLDVVRKREDGYHEVRMIMQTIGLYDKLTINRCNHTGVIVKTNLHYLPTDDNNLCYKAAALIKKEYNINQGVSILLEKKIPVAAGMAGGSTDAAATLFGLSRLFDLKLSREKLMELGLKLGADVPYCIMRGTALSEGIGEVLTPLPHFPACHVLIVKPSINVSTKYVYEHLKLNETINHPNIDGIIKGIEQNNLYTAISDFGNILETVTMKDYPIIGTIKEKMLEYGALVSLMSGSGPTVFGLFDDLKAAEKAFYQFKISELSKQVFLTNLYHPVY
ncbi:4-diphosphocytidyl-2-C-methyl-D-erythritol kinase [Anaerocolumna cellulosilytica]|uniref:4-diphosphocytidyl-2-C-methyl-D-erythritol kinase n=1 Tax=Anaerocolumna cellulosilytica TaxID=433286 RepID=A0A6S6QZS0_9FIRM|nr:4-(cytidine 5'-diphospho)-2-C-methyl-D-erythritol kinase [Anaerocolumna cellulosilytica]MBB5196179.1 4-diphosphocytidyl-2-C-methyl-D-erythritol kinase [Anaerocolumna cellulosilytica]BCJ92501.1 4-diphosphocytidyl-2-C-methyl-D-erythritol kinase [Anaerocolumna cellulosilytica]